MESISNFNVCIFTYLVIGWIFAFIVLSKFKEVLGKGSAEGTILIFISVLLLWPLTYRGFMKRLNSASWLNEHTKVSNTKVLEIQWRRASAGTKLPGDNLIKYDADPDVRLGRCMIYDGWYIPTSEIVKYIK